MTYFLLPRVCNYDIKDNIELELTKNEEEIFLQSKSLRLYLNEIKKNINKVASDWDIHKKQTNPYEYIHTTISSIHKMSVSKLKPLSRAFYKMIEILGIFSILEEYSDDYIKTFHLAEGPGGFIEAFIFLRKNISDKYYGMTLISDNINIPSWKKSKLFLQNNNNIIIEKGITETGDLLNKNNLLYCLNNYHNSMDIITGDGGFDFSLDFNKQEQKSMSLIFAQICFALAMQKFNGTFILKIFDIFTHASVDLLYILSNYYERVYIIKPNTSRAANSEKYVVCKNYRLQNSHELVYKLSKLYDNLDSEDFIKRFLNFDISYYYKNKLDELNAIF